MQKLIIGITGKKGSGKDTFAGLLENSFKEQNVSIRQYAFADPMKAALSTALCVPKDNFYLQELKEQPLAQFGGVTPRTLMQQFGTEFMQNHCGKNVWTTVAKNWIDSMDESIIIVTDARFEQELKFIRSFKNNFMVFLNRPGLNSVDGHSSENGLSVDQSLNSVIVSNSGTRLDLADQARSFAAEIIKCGNFSQKQFTT